MPDSTERARTLSIRAKAYSDLGQENRALADLEESIHLHVVHRGEPHLPMYEKGLLLQSMGSKTESESTLIDAGRALAIRNAVRRGVPSTEAARFVEELRAFPATAQHALPMSEVDRITNRLIYVTRSGDIRDQRFAAFYLADRAGYYRRLGQHALADTDAASAELIDPRIFEGRDGIVRRP